MSAPVPALRWLPRPRPISPRFSAQLDCFRWVAALAVCTMHVRSLVLADYDPSQPHNLTVKLFYGLQGFGHEAVIIFFVLSGYLVGGEVIRGLQQQTFDGMTYLLRRVARLYPVYVVALLLGSLVDHLGLYYTGAGGLYTHAIDIPMISFDISAQLSFSLMLQNLFFLQGLACPSYGSNSPLWSLTNEVSYYILFPLLAWLLFVSARPWRKITASVVVVLITVFTARQVLSLFPIWLLGLVPHLLHRPLFKSWVPGILLLLSLGLIRTHPTGTSSEALCNLLIGATFALLLNSLDHSPASGAMRGAKYHRSMAGFSYSLYLIHLPITVFMVAILHSQFGIGLRMNLTATSLVIYGSLLATVYLYAWGVAQCTERHTPRIRRWLLAFANQRAQQSLP